LLELVGLGVGRVGHYVVLSGPALLVFRRQEHLERVVGAPAIVSTFKFLSLRGGDTA
jgi:hypothetical protein